MLIASRQDRERLGLAQALEACRCYSPQGRRLKAAYRYYSPEEKGLLEAELTAIDRLSDFVKNKKAELLDIQGLLAHLRDLRGSLAGLKKGRLLDITELFELKQTARLIRKLADHQVPAEKAGVTLKALPELESLLDPSGLGTSGFYLYDDYSPRLAQVRRERSLLENRLEGGLGDRPALLAERRRLIEEEEKEEGIVRRRLCEAIRPYEVPLQENLDQAGQLDFRLAKAGLALHWGASRPILLEAGERAILEEFHHPVIEGHLLARGGVYVRQTLAVEKGSTVLSGPNMGGKSVTLKALTLSLVLLHLGYFPPAAYLASPLFDFVSYSSDHLDTTKRGLSSFASEMVSLRDLVDRSRKARGFLVIDEPCRGTNPREATALIGALCRFFARGPGSLVLATHYPIPAGDGIRHIRIKGIQEEALRAVLGAGPRQVTDPEAIRRIEALMDYSLEAVEGDALPQEGAIRLARWLGMDEEVLDLL